MDTLTDQRSGIRPEAEISDRVEKISRVLNVFRFGSTIFPLLGMGAAAIAGPEAIWIAAVTTGLSLLGTRLASDFKSKELQKKIKELRITGAISDPEADRLEIMARSIVSGAQPETAT